MGKLKKHKIMEENKLPQPASHLGYAIFVTVACCWPFGIPAIVNASRVSRLYNEGNYDGAVAAAAAAKKWANIALIVGIVLGVLFTVIYGVAVYSMMSNGGMY